MTFKAFGCIGIIGKETLSTFPALMKRFEIIGKDCNQHQPFDMCAPYDNNKCKVDIAFYFDYCQVINSDNICLEDMKNPFDVIARHLDKVTAYLSCFNVKEGQVAEIFNVCTQNVSRGQRHMVEIFTKLEEYLRAAGASMIWLGIDLNNPLWSQVLKLYVKLGFKDPKITRSTIGGFNIPMKVLRLTKNLKVVANQELDALLIANNLRDEYLVLNTDGPTTNIFISSVVLKAMRDAYLDKEKEYAGIFISTNSKIVNDKRCLELVYPTDTETSGDPVKFTVVPPNNAAFSFHTHPSICYRKLGCYIGWPSGPDMGFVVGSYDTALRKHFVITVEGVFSIQMNRHFINFWKQLLNEGNCKHEIVKCVVDKFSEFHQHREKVAVTNRRRTIDPELRDHLIETQIAQDTFRDYETIVNNYKLSDLIKELNERYNYEFISKCTKHYENINDFKLFMVGFKNWEQIESNNGFVDTINVHKRKTSPIVSNNMEFTLQLQPENTNPTKEQRYLTKPGTFYYKKPVIPIHKHTIKVDISPSAMDLSDL